MKNYIVIFIFLFCNGSFSQEVLTNLSNMPFFVDVKKASLIEKNILTLPFIDDFSYSGSYPDNNLWSSSSSIFINSTYAVNPPTIGVATFDGLNFNRKPYSLDLTSAMSGSADTLLSREIDLSTTSNVYFLFYYCTTIPG